MENKAIKELRDPQFFISKSARQLYDNAKENIDEFKRMQNKDFLMLAVVFGFLNQKKKKLENKDKAENGLCRLDNLSPAETAVIKAIAVSEMKDIGIIRNIPEILRITEEYANGGASYLKEFLFEDQASLSKKFAHIVKERN